MLKGDNPGKLDRRITLQQQSTAKNAYGGTDKTWSTLATVWAAIEYAKTGSDEVVDSGLNLATTRTVFTIRYRDDVGFVERVLYKSEIYDVERIAEVGREDFLQLTTERKK